MSRLQKELEAKLQKLSREQTPAGWTRLKARAQTEQPARFAASKQTAPAKNTTTTRSANHMNKKWKWITSISAAAIVLVIAAVLAFQLLPGPAIGQLEAGQHIKLADGALFINNITRTGGKIGMPPDAETVDLTWADLPAIFGREPVPALPAGLKPDSETISAIMFRSGSVFLMNGIAFSADPQDPDVARVFIDLNDNGELPLTDCLFGVDKNSILNGVEMKVGIETVEGENGTTDMYTAVFVANNIGYRIRATNMTGDAFIEVLEALAKG